MTLSEYTSKELALINEQLKQNFSQRDYVYKLQMGFNKLSDKEADSILREHANDFLPSDYEESQAKSIIRMATMNMDLLTDSPLSSLLKSIEI